MRQALTVLLIVDAFWMILGATARVLIQVTESQQLDPIPFISATLGSTTLAILAFNRRTIDQEMK